MGYRESESVQSCNARRFIHRKTVCLRARTYKTKWSANQPGATLSGMNIVVLDGYTLDPGDLSWAKLNALGPATIYDRSSPGEVIQRAAEAEIVLTNKAELNRAHIDALRK